MKVLIAKTAGFCFGVKRAVNLAFNTDTQQQTYTLGPIIHNDRVIERLRKEGITAIEKEDMVEKTMDTLIIRAHGVGKEIYQQAKEQNVHLVDATCPYVKKIHKIVKEHSERGYGIMIIGDANHPEVQGIKGWVEGICHIIKDEKHMGLEQLDKEIQYIAVAQTTYKRVVVDEVLERLVKEAYQVEYLSTICNATTERQEEAELISKKVDAMIVIGSPSSSNTQKLYEICHKNCPDTWCINDVSQLDIEKLKNKEQVGITAGASTPEDLICEVVEVLNRYQ